jgi:hypothetical protein
MSAAGMSAINKSGETNVVTRFAPFHNTTDVEAKLAPLTVSEKPAPPVDAEFGLRLFRTGALCARAEAVDSRSRAIMKVRPLSFGRTIRNMLF